MATPSNLVVRVNGDLNTGAFTTSYNLDGAGYIDLITDGAGMTDINEIILAVEGTTAWNAADHIDINFMTLQVVPEPSSTALLGLGGLALLFRRRK